MPRAAAVQSMAVPAPEVAPETDDVQE